MYFEVENTPEHIRRTRRKEIVMKTSPKEECPRLIIAPFSRPPQVVFEDVLIGTTCEKILEVFNPSKQMQQITLGKAIPAGLQIPLPGEWLVLEPETCYYLTMIWTPMQPIALRETIRFTNDNRGRYDVIVVLKSVMNIKGAKLKGYKTSPGKIKKKVSKKSPVAKYKKKAEIMYNTAQIKKSVNVFTQHKVYATNNENMSTFNEQSNDYQSNCPFGSPTSVDLNFDTSEIFSNLKKERKYEALLQKTYDKSYTSSNVLNVPQNILKPSNKQTFDKSATDIFDNFTFTPLKSLPKENDKLAKGPKIILSMNSDSEFEDSFEINNCNKENVSHNIIGVKSSQPIQRPHIGVQYTTYTTNQYTETPINQNKKIPNTSSPKEMNSPNFSINTELSRISDLSFCPQRFSTERKIWPKVNNETQDMIDDINKLNSDTYTKDSPNPPMEVHINEMYMENRIPHFFMRDPKPKMCRQSLFREYQQIHDRNYLNLCESNVWQTNLRPSVRSPPRSITPPLQSIPEESMQLTYTQVDKSDKQMTTFTINRTFDKDERSAVSNSRESWSKKAVRVEPELWKVPAPVTKKSSKPRESVKSKESIGGKVSNTTFEGNKSNIQNLSLNYIGNVYSQSLTVDPFMSSTYYYDEDAVHRFEKEFIRWLNYILTPPAELDSNEEQTIDVGKAWIENRNKEIPAAPTKEQVSNAYHNSHRLESLRRSARALFLSSDIAQVFLKLNAQIEKKLIAIRTDKNLHLDIGLQKIIMELILSYNPLWLRIGLEAIYGVVLPLKSNNDIEGLTSFIIQRMFKNPYLKNKNSKSTAPNMLQPAYMEAIKKFTLKKFFMLIFFLDQAKQRKLISHDPCLFRRNAICKESKEIIFKFTRELIAGIGDITKHLRPLGYVVSHKQSYLDEYKYAVHNIAVDIRDGVRLTKVMEVILMKNGLLNQLRTPAISRMQKIHNVQVALTALKEANFVIVGDITAKDIADGHREKTLSLLWQLIHVFRAPLFEKAASVIQMWWKKKYEVIVEKRKEQERILQQKHNAASIIQYWWRQIQYNRMVEFKIQQVTTATVTIQKYCRRWLCQSRLRRFKKSVLKIEEWYRSVKMIKEAKKELQMLRVERDILWRNSATVIQSYVRRWLCMKLYKRTLKRIVQIQSVIRYCLARKKYIELKENVVYIQRKYKGKLLMKEEMKKLAEKRNKAIVIQSYYRMIKQRRLFIKLKTAVRLVEDKYSAKLLMRKEREEYLNLRSKAILLQSLYRGKTCCVIYQRQRKLLVNLQRKIRGYLLMKKERTSFLRIKNAVVTIQRQLRSYFAMKQAKQVFINQRKSAIVIQRYYRSYLLTKYQRDSFIQLRKAAVIIQTHYRSRLAMRRQRLVYMKLRNAVLTIQSRYRARISMKCIKEKFEKLRFATITIQRRYRALIEMRKQRLSHIRTKTACVFIQRYYRARILGRKQRNNFLIMRQATVIIQNWFRNCRQCKQIKNQYQESKQACVTIQRNYRAYIIGRKQRHEYVRIKTATVCIQRYYRAYIEMKIVRQEFIRLKTSTVTIQRVYRSFLEMKMQRHEYLKIRSAAIVIQKYYKQYRNSKIIRQKYCELRNIVICLQQKYRNICATRTEHQRFLKFKKYTLIVQQRFRALIAMKIQRQEYLKYKLAATVIQRRFRAQYLMKKDRNIYIKTRKACLTIQRLYRARMAGKKQRDKYLKLKQAAVIFQKRYKSLLEIRKCRTLYLSKMAATVTIQIRFRAQYMMRVERNRYITIRNACIAIQSFYKAYILGKYQRQNYLSLKNSAIILQQRYRALQAMRSERKIYTRKVSAIISIQRRFRRRRENIRNEAAKKIQCWYRSIKKRNEHRNQYLKIKKSVVILQSEFRRYLMQKRFYQMKTAVITIQSRYRAHKLASKERQLYIRTLASITTIQSYVRCFVERRRYLRIRSAVLTIQAAYRLKKTREITIKRRVAAAVCLQKFVRRYLTQKWYKNYVTKITFVQKIWRGKLVTRLMRCEFLQKRALLIKLQSVIRGYLVRKQVQCRRETLGKEKEIQRKNWAASKIQALFRGHRARVNMSGDMRVAELRHRWRNGALVSTQESLKERNEEAMDVLRNMSDIETVINAFRSLELLTEVFPMMYNENASAIVRRIYVYMSVTNRSISSIEVLRSASSILVNLTRYRVTGPKIYARDRIPPILKFMLRFSNTETHLFCVLSTYLWLFSKYISVREDLGEFLHLPENHKMLTTIKGNIVRMKRMASNARNKFLTPQPSKTVSHTTTSREINQSICSTKGNISITLPALEPDYGITRIDKPRYFEDAHQAINCLFRTYKL